MGFMGIRNAGGYRPQTPYVAPGQEIDPWIHQTLSPETPGPCASKVDVRELIICLSEFYGLDTKKVLRIGWCESGLQNAKNPHSSAKGIFQWLDSFRSTVVYRFADSDSSWYHPTIEDTFGVYWHVRLTAWHMSKFGYSAWVCQ